jgi:hypothetical protein
MPFRVNVNVCRIVCSFPCQGRHILVEIEKKEKDKERRNSDIMRKKENERTREWESKRMR